MWIPLALSSALAYGVSDYLGGAAARKYSAVFVSAGAFVCSTSLALMLLVVNSGHPTAGDIYFSIGSGFCNALALVTFFTAMSMGKMSVISPVTAILVAGLPIAFSLLSGQQLSPLQISGIVCGLVAVVLLSMTSGGEAPAITGSPVLVWALTLISGVSFAGILLCLHHISPQAGLSPVALSRGTALLLLLPIVVYLWSKSERCNFDSGIWKWCLGIGLCDMVGTTSSLYAVHHGVLAIVAVLMALYPVGTIVLAVVVAKERVLPLQYVGLTAALVAVVLMASAAR